MDIVQARQKGSPLELKWQSGLSKRENYQVWVPRILMMRKIINNRKKKKMTTDMPHLWQAFPKVQRVPALHINQTSSKQEDEINVRQNWPLSSEVSTVIIL